MLGGFPIPGPDRLDIEVTITHGEVQNPSLTGRFDPRHKAHSGRRCPEPASCEPTLAIEDEVSEWSSQKAGFSIDNVRFGVIFR